MVKTVEVDGREYRVGMEPGDDRFPVWADDDAQIGCIETRTFRGVTMYTGSSVGAGATLALGGGVTMANPFLGETLHPTIEAAVTDLVREPALRRTVNDLLRG